MNAEVNALERLQIVRGSNSSCFGSKIQVMHGLGKVFWSFQLALHKRLVDDHLGGDIRQFTSLPKLHLLSHRLKVALHSVNPNRDAVNEFYKKGCQEKTSASTGGREDMCLDLQPTVCASAPRCAQGFCSGWFSLPVVFAAGGDNANRV